MELEISKLFSGITVNINVNVDENVVKMLSQLLQNATSQNNNPVSSEESHNEETATPKKRQRRQKKENVSVQTINIPEICKTIREYLGLAQSGVDIKETSSILNEEILKMSESQINVRLGHCGRGRAIMPNFSKTARIAAAHPTKWPGWIHADKMEEELTSIFSQTDNSHTDVQNTEHISTTPAGTKRRKYHKTPGYKQGSYQRVQRGSMMMRMRCHRDKDELAPMVVDYELANELFTKGFTHVKIGSFSKNGQPVDESRGINLIFTKENVRTRAEKNSKTLSRLHPYGYQDNEITTFAINGDAFQRTILNHFKETCTGLKECFFKLVPSGRENENGIAYRIEKVANA